MSDGIDSIELLARSLLRSVAAPERRRILREVARDVRAGQAARIGRQQEPDGTGFAPRRATREARPGGYAVKFLYPKGAAEPRRVFMKSWTREGPLLTGYDIEAGGIRSFFWDQVAQWLPVDADEQNGAGRKLRRKGKLREKAMFRKLKGPRQLKAANTADEAWVGWIGRAADVARVHHDGGTERLGKRGKPVRYARRVLLGLTTAERGALVDAVIERLARFRVW